MCFFIGFVRFRIEISASRTKSQCGFCCLVVTDLVHDWNRAIDINALETVGISTTREDHCVFCEFLFASES